MSMICANIKFVWNGVFYEENATFCSIKKTFNGKLIQAKLTSKSVVWHHYAFIEYFFIKDDLDDIQEN